MDQIHKNRLLNVARALRESQKPESFDMSRYGHNCKTPACALGHYAHRDDLQGLFGLTQKGYLILRESKSLVEFDDAPAVDHFGINGEEALELFGADDGCGGANSVDEAADYIEAFVANHGAGQ